VTAFAFPKPVRAAKSPRKLLLRRSSRLRRTWMRPRRPRRLDTAQSNPAYLDWLHTRGCCALGLDTLGRCGGRIEAHHAGRKPGVGMKCPDDEAIALCTVHHDQLTRHVGVFAGWSRFERRQWSDAWIATMQAAFLSAGSRRSS